MPGYYEQDDFQVRTPTDIIGQHIHLVKFDVTSSDGSGNGFNYEDGTFSPHEVIERIDAIRLQNNCKKNDSRNGTFACPLAKAHPFFNIPGAQTTVHVGLPTTHSTTTIKTGHSAPCLPTTTLVLRLTSRPASMPD